MKRWMIAVGPAGALALAGIAAAVTTTRSTSPAEAATAATTQVRREPPTGRPVPLPRPVPPFERRPLPPPLPFDRGVVVKEVLVNADVRDGVAETTVTHLFENRTDRPQEGDFVFPIPPGATVSSFAMYDGETRLDAKLLDQETATSTYEEIVRRQRDPALLTYAGRGALRARVFPIAPHQTRKLTLKLATVLPREGDAKKYAWTLAGPYLPGSQAPERVSVRVNVVSAQGGIGNVYSPTHEVGLRRDSNQRVVATWASDKKKGEQTALSENPEFALYVAPNNRENVALSVLTYNAALPQVASLGGGARQSGYFLVVASPAIASASAERSALPRRVIAVFDRSGSMQGKKIEQAKASLRFALGRLRPQDTFNVITFSDRVENFAPRPVAATPDNLKRADAFVDDIIADGGTNIDAALREGLAQFPERGSGNTLLFMTDGLPTVGNTDRDAIVRKAVETNGRKARVFAFGVGYDVDVPFLDRVGQSLRGDADYVRPDEDIEVKVSRFVAKTSAPVLENLKLNVAGVNAGEIYPRPGDLPDLFAGSQLVLVGRYTGGSGAQPGRITLTGEANGQPQTYSLAARFPAVDTDSDFLPRLWATRKIGYLLDEVRLRENSPSKQEVVQQIIALSKEFGVLTPYTAMFVPEPGTEIQTANGNVLMFRDRARVTPGGAGRGGLGGGGGGFGGGGAAAPSVTSAAVPASRSGESAVNASQGARASRVAGQVGNAQVYAGKAGAERARDESLARRVQNVAARTFFQVGANWTDATYDAKKQTQVVKVKLYSPAYFALTRRNADLAKWAALGPQVLVRANATQAIQFGDDGKEALTEAEVKALAGK